MTPLAKRSLAIAGGVLLAVVLAIAFPAILAFLERAARELRYLWWLVLLLCVGAWLIYFGRRAGR